MKNLQHPLDGVVVLLTPRNETSVGVSFVLGGTELDDSKFRVLPESTMAQMELPKCLRP